MDVQAIQGNSTWSVARSGASPMAGGRHANQYQAALGSGDITHGQAWRWVGLLVIFAVLYIAAGIFAFGPLLEDA